MGMFKRNRTTGGCLSLRYSVANLRQVVFGKTGHFHDRIAVDTVLQNGKQILWYILLFCLALSPLHFKL
ncbi:Uncharacterised protein [Klebsiella quasipneumoniae]|jgi:hypothetical protein|uniref:Uncharacterized protein n=1 Tax=Klebsiella quasipneumoniae TaxID=1463165 RepID=A0A7L7TD29_9ENTR|nr:hypothetical protein P821_05317 [Klebsiella variicola]QOC74681.1 Hypothetical protein [Klebsiella quasipneumoniae]TDV00704.1 hypothetical protein DFO76_1304 [Raoultella planticola]CAE6294671.1 hypothetical protein AI2705V1_4101 [Enterobacter cloacae]CAI9396508.1 hypothetical protein CITSP_05164 [Citrobacter sp. T1.2D-1]CAI9408212.1 hypothetical protein CCAJJPOJ_04369 [Lelliottia sp. T2.26D-8]CZV89931.1 Uncharacterised protein [Enterobacter hormaechei]STF60008.1 Uncharacterised protein [Es